MEDFSVQGQNFAIAGSLTTLPIEAYKSCLYICPDTPSDTGVEGGFPACSSGFKNSIQVPFDPSSPQFQTGGGKSPYEALLQFNAFQSAIDSMPKPLIIICKSARRAGAVLAAYKAVKEGLSIQETENFSDKAKLSYVGSPVMNAWVNTVVQHLSPTTSYNLRQLFEKDSSTYTYLLSCPLTNEAILIDPVVDTVARDSALVNELGLTLKYVVNTHVHAGTNSLMKLVNEFFIPSV